MQWKVALILFQLFSHIYFKKNYLMKSSSFLINKIYKSVIQFYSMYLCSKYAQLLY